MATAEWTSIIKTILFVCRGYGGGLTPLLDADGKPIITKDGYQK